MPKITIAQTVNKMKLGGADKVSLTNILNGLADDIELLRAKNLALATKLDTNHGAAADHAATVAVAAGGLSVGK